MIQSKNKMSNILSTLILGTGIGLLGSTVTFVWHNSKAYHRKYSDTIIIFSRYPERGITKTRLITELGEDGAATLQQFMTDHIVDQVQSYVQFQSNTAVNFQYAGGDEAKVKYWLGRKAMSFPRFEWSPQVNGHLGCKMSKAFKKAFLEGTEKVVLVGSDIPGINKEVLSEAFSTLNPQSCDMVLGPAKDGGYYLVGLCCNTLKDLSTLFEGVDWGTSEVCQQQVSIAKAHNLRIQILKQTLQDVDDGDDLPEFEEKVGVSLQELKEPVLSVIVPTYNEEGSIASTLENLVQLSRFPFYLEIIVSDGGSRDRTKEIVKEFAKTCKTCPVTLVDSPKGRGKQLNVGAKYAKGFNLLFVHADTSLPRSFDSHVMVTLSEPGVICGAFEFALDVVEHDRNSYEQSESNMSDHKTEDVERRQVSFFFKYQMMILCWFTNRRAKIHELPYGDQGLFMRRKTFNAVNGFPEYLLMEDYAMVKTLQQRGQIKIVEGEKAITSARRWMKHGLLKVTGFNRLMVILYNLGIHPDTLGRWYYGIK